MDSPKVSIITRTRNRPLLLQRALHSVLGQENAPPWEWIVVNDGGDREEVERILERARESAPRSVSVLHLDASRGMERASNAGITLSTGRFLAIHDDDDSWQPSFLQKMTAFLEHPSNRGIGGVICHSIRIIEEIEDEKITSLQEHPFNDHLRDLTFWEVLKENPFPPISFLFRRSAYEEAGPFDESLPVLGDWEFNLRLLARHPLGVLPEALANYHHRPPNTVSANANSITLQHNRHREIEQQLRERWSHSNPFGIPVEVFAPAAAIAGNLHRMQTGLDRLSHAVSRLPVPVPPQF